VNSEYGSLKKILLYKPQKKGPKINSPERVQHLRPLKWNDFRKETSALKKTFQKNGVEVLELETTAFENPPPNLMFLRDHFFMTPWGAILGRMASSIRAGEEKWAQLAIAKAGIPILQMIRGIGTFEGADAIWIHPRLVAVGIGNRTNQEGFFQIRRALSEFGVESQALPLPSSVQHLLGLVQVIDKNVTLVRTSLASKKVIKLFEKNSYHVIGVPEIAEVVLHQGMNLVALGPKKILMPAECPKLRELYVSHDIKIASEISINEYINAAGGIACATAILSRQLR
jgi:N-dimethylarginine dimethylaminohydrolase